MATFEVTPEGEITFKCKVDEIIKYADCIDVDDSVYTCGLVKFAELVEHVVDKKPSNWCNLGTKFLKQMGFHRYKVTSSNWHPLEPYARSKEEAARMCSHLKGVKITQNKKWEEN